MLTFYNKYASNTYSQCGEDGVLAEIYKRIPFPKEVAEWGIHNSKFCSNTRLLVEQGAHGTWVEFNEDLYQQAKVNSEELNVDLYCSAIGPENVNALIPMKVDIVSLDTDGQNDYHTFQAMKQCPDVVIVEINSSYAPMIDRLDEGANYSIMVKLAREKGYFLLCHTGNLVFISNTHRGKFMECVGDGLVNWEEYFNDSWYNA